jgi:hypothetical protein
MARVFAVQVQICGRIRVSRYKADRKQVIGHGIVILLTAVVRGHGLSRITGLSREAVVKSKNRDKFINSTVRVIASVYF